MTPVRLEAIEGQDDLPLRCESFLEAGMIGQTEGDQLFVALDKVGDSALRQGNAARKQVLVDLANTAMLSVTQGADECDHIEAEFAVRERPASFFFRPVGVMKAGTGWRDATADVERQPVDPGQGRDRAAGVVDGPQRTVAVRAAGPYWLQELVMGRRGTAGATCHVTSPIIYIMIVMDKSARV